jgi:DNA repair exonuclease SbcCD nuclease subunit
MQFISISDTHLGLSTDSEGIDDPESGINIRARDGFQALDQVIDYAIVNKIKLIVHSGDVFNSKNIGQNNIHAFYERVKRALDAGIFLYVLAGNHDASVFTLRKIPLDLVTTLDILNTHFTRGNDYLDLGYIQIVSLSYWNTTESIIEFLDKVSKENVDWKRPTLLVAHLEINYPGSIGSFKESLNAIPLEVLTKHKWDAVQLGHIHEFKILNESPKVFYTGSLVRCTFAEEQFEKGFWVNTMDNGKFTMQQIPIECLQMLTLKGTMDDIRIALTKAKPRHFKNVIVRVIVDTTKEEIDEKFFKTMLAEAFKFRVIKQAQTKKLRRMDAVGLSTMTEYAERYFANEPRKAELMILLNEIKKAEESKI